MNQKRMGYAPPQHITRKLVVESGAIPYVVEIGFSVTRDVESLILFNTGKEPLVVIPVRRIDRHGPVSVSMLHQEDAKVVPQLARLTLLERGKAEPFMETGEVSEDFLVSQNISLEFLCVDLI